MAVRNQDFTVEASEASQRLDQYLARKFPQVSRSYLQKQLEEEAILLNQRPARKGTLLQAGDCISVREILEERERTLAPNADLAVEIVQEEKSFAVVLKPAGLPSHPVQHDDLNTVVNWWIAQHPEVATRFEDPLRAGVVHRLDTDTSGLLILARDPETLEALQSQFRERRVHKEYWALVYGTPPRQGVIETPLAHDPRNQRRMMAVVRPHDLRRLKYKEARTEFRRVESSGPISLVRIRTLTGRMHQVRVHMASIGCPLVGDALYARPNQPKKLQTPNARHYLHATFLEFENPETGAIVRHETDLPAEFRAILEAARSEESPS